MARPARPQHAAFLHLFNRGNERRRVFEDDLDRMMFLRILEDVVRTFGWVLHGYCLMPNHYHLLVDVAAGVLSDSMRMLDQVYAQSFNRRWERVGHLWQGRFGSVIVQKSSHMDVVGTYTVLNPVRAKLVADPADWRWSSFLATAGLAPVPDWLHVDTTLARFGETRSVAQANYQKAVRSAIGGPSPWDAVVGGLVLGDAEFIAETQSLLNELKLSPEVPLRQRILSRVSLSTIAKALAMESGIAPSAILEPRSRDRDASAVFAHLARTEAGHPLRMIADSIQMSIATASRLGTAGKELSRSAPWDDRIAIVRRKLEMAGLDPAISMDAKWKM